MSYQRSLDKLTDACKSSQLIHKQFRKEIGLFIDDLIDLIDEAELVGVILPRDYSVRQNTVPFTVPGTKIPETYLVLSKLKTIKTTDNKDYITVDYELRGSLECGKTTDQATVGHLQTLISHMRDGWLDELTAFVKKTIQTTKLCQKSLQTAAGDQYNLSDLIKEVEKDEKDKS